MGEGNNIAPTNWRKAAHVQGTIVEKDEDLMGCGHPCVLARTHITEGTANSKYTLQNWHFRGGGEGVVQWGGGRGSACLIVAVIECMGLSGMCGREWSYD